MSTLSKTPIRTMAIDEFEVWWSEHPDIEARFELVDGQPVRLMSPERIRHGQANYRVTLALSRSITECGLSCEAIIDSASLRIDEKNSRIPDVSVMCGQMDPDSIWLEHPVVVVEIVSPTSERRDAREKLLDYFRVDSVMHYLVVFPMQRRVIHHRRAPVGDEIITRILGEGMITLDPPGFAVAIEELLGPDTTE